MKIGASEFSPLFGGGGVDHRDLFAFLLGFGATLAEARSTRWFDRPKPDQRSIQKVYADVQRRDGVAVGISLGIAKLVIGFDLMKVLLPFTASGVLTVLSTEEFVNVGWDSAGVTTGPVTVPLVLAMGLGLGNAVSAVEGFGILSLASICPIVAVLSMGIFIRIRASMSQPQADAA